MRFWKSIPLLLCLTALGQNNDYSNFAIIGRKNIFDPNRGIVNVVPIHIFTNYDTFTLVGTMQYERGKFYFFDGTKIIYQKAVKTNDHLAQYTVSPLSGDAIVLVSSNETLKIKVGTTVTNFSSGVVK